MQLSENTVKSPNTVSMSVKDCGSTLIQHWVNATGLFKVYSRRGDILVLGQRRRRLNQQWAATPAQH